MNTHVRGDAALRAARMRGIRSHSLSNSASEFVCGKTVPNAALDRVDCGRASAIGEMERLQKQADARERTVPNVDKKRNEEER